MGTDLESHWGSTMKMDLRTSYKKKHKPSFKAMMLGYVRSQTNSTAAIRAAGVNQSMSRPSLAQPVRRGADESLRFLGKRKGLNGSGAA